MVFCLIWQMKACGLPAFNMALGFFLSCRQFSVALNPVGALGNGYVGLYIESTVALLRDPNPGSGSLGTRRRVNHCFVN